MISKENINLYAIKTISFLTPHFLQIRRLNKIETKARQIAINKNIPFLVRCEILDEMDRKPEAFSSIGFHFEFEQMVNGKYKIFIYKQCAMAPELDILITIFHEYGHFINYCTSNKTKKPFLDIYFSNQLPKFYGYYDEDFPELFARYMLDLVSIDTHVSTILNNIIQEGISNLSDGDKKRCIDVMKY